MPIIQICLPFVDGCVLVRCDGSLLYLTKCHTDFLLSEITLLQQNRKHHSNTVMTKPLKLI